MKPWVKTAIGLLSHVPGLYMLYFMGFFIYLVTHPNAYSGRGAGMPVALVVMFICHVLMILLTMLLMAFWTIWLLKGSDLPQDHKIIWALATFFLGPVIMPVLYWMHLRKTPTGSSFFGAPQRS